MILITGGLFSGKKTFARELLREGQTLEEAAVWEVQELVRQEMAEEDVVFLAEELAKKQMVLFTETGGGVVPMDPKERQCRELAGRLGCLLAQRAETVVRLYCGIPLVLKGRLEE
ncbi:bifunctional adenosylcobinamide kinase/adenosylcobinamide-phosphate guanylyltransferase [Anaerotignum lactatifermentans]|uniref:Bifunctional adenosylcobinamide kinase/adenosylcobinamide-phosphate guanylyltransferase n=1 Tax=Anaerotignum lactatifermentans TaxID=160404 RepID=A0ABS2GBT8_9FIRM|nr:bifunctional adenosylcobinamide kinase/adenosylcobinamide-phosphate guanylyltransferase [Anaerotignum lactatifermentans]MBM6829807.1 bifunctional adenosylcobinamide kinase/adenosylcobinamide-phosphate guanylyltransferase [Anaerotignum lactatifermentans]MBM6878253.1 bifunctional adenosylcobinamide kinase/adenosylcobinamide-phosphate guanylyltransferase [Anaerotignum lactatifermentans]MBM6951333.1 bifunctional adenosylcobinamide kinase/adenosylcobinamide-phosphate guanylyltransferase [Anaerotig